MAGISRFTTRWRIMVAHSWIIQHQIAPAFQVMIDHRRRFAVLVQHEAGFLAAILFIHSDQLVTELRFEHARHDQCRRAQGHAGGIVDGRQIRRNCRTSATGGPPGPIANCRYTRNIGSMTISRAMYSPHHKPV